MFSKWKARPICRLQKVARNKLEQKITLMKIYRLTWYFEVEDQLKETLITNKEIAEERY